MTDNLRGATVNPNPPPKNGLYNKRIHNNKMKLADKFEQLKVAKYIKVKLPSQGT